MAKLHIDRLSLEAPGILEQDGRRLALLITNGLASAIPNTSSGNIDRIRINLPAGSADNIDRLADQIVAEILQQLERTL